MSAFNYRSTSNGDIENTKIVVITQIDLINLRCEVYDRANKNKFLVYMLSAPGLFYHRPVTGEEWIVKKINGMWVFDRKTALQNKAIVALKVADPGDVILSASNNIRVISPLIQENETARWTASSVITSTPLMVPGTLIASDPTNNLATIVGNTLKMKSSGTYAIGFFTDADLTTINRALLQITSGIYVRRTSFGGEDQASLDVVLPLQKDAIVNFGIFHTTGANRTFVSSIDITRIR